MCIVGTRWSTATADNKQLDAGNKSIFQNAKIMDTLSILDTFEVENKCDKSL